MKESIRPELSKANKYWLDRRRYYELKYFCLQYPLWKKAYKLLDGLNIKSYDLACNSKTNLPGDPTGKSVEERSIYLSRMSKVERAAIETDPYLAEYLLKAVTEGYSYDICKAKLEIPCSRDTYYDRYRRFFWLLDKIKN